MASDSAPPIALRSPGEVEAIAARIFPGMPLRWEGVSHVAAGVDVSGSLAPFRIGHPAAPASRWDRFVLDLSRLRADAIVVTGAILRAEPELNYAWDPAWARAFDAARRSLRVRARPLLIVLTRRGVDPRHPALSGAVEPVVTRARSLTEAIDDALARGAESVSIEAGPETAAELYAAPHRIDELLFHRFPGRLPSEALAGAFARESDVVDRLGEARSRVSVEDGPSRSVIERYAR